MPDAPDLEAMWRDVVAANLRYYESWAHLASEWLHELADAGTRRRQSGDNAARQVPSTAAAPASGPMARRATSSSPMLVLEARAGKNATGAFLVENQLGYPVETPMIADQVTDPSGMTLPAELKFEPAIVSLDAGERCVVRVQFAATEAFRPGIDYKTVIRGPNLPGTSIPVILRRADPTD